MVDTAAPGPPAPADGGRRIVLTAPLTETIDHAGYFIQMSMASLPVWLEGILNRKYPRGASSNTTTTARRATCRQGSGCSKPLSFSASRPTTWSAAIPDDLDRFVGPNTRVVAVSTHNPLGVTFAAGVYTSIFGSSNQSINSYYARQLFARIKNSPCRSGFQVMVGGSGGWQVTQTNAYEELGIDCVVEGRSESAQTIELFERALAGERLPRQVDVAHPKSRDAIIFPDKRTTFGVVEMTTGCGRRCQFCVPDLNPQIDLPKDKIMAAVRANVRDGNKQISLATEDMFIWGQVHTDTPFYFPNREALLDLYRRDRGHARRRAARAQPRDDRAGGRRSGADPAALRHVLDKSPIHLPLLSTPPEEEGARAADRARDRIGALAKQIMPSKGVPFPIDEWPSVVVRGLEVLNANNWFPAMTLIVGSPGETDDDCGRRWT